MFAVSGWNVSSTKLVKEQPKRQSSVSKPIQVGSESNKRKRSDRDGEGSRKINGSDLDQLWNQRFGEVKVSGDQPKTHGKQKGAATGTDPKLLSPARSTALQQRQKRDNSRTTGDGRASASKSLAPKPNLSRPPHTDRDVETKPSKAGKKEQKYGKKERETTGQTAVAVADSIASSLPPPPPPASNLTPLQAKMRSKLTSARFRHLNETLYTNPSATALSLFATTPALFAEYHDGFSQQVASSWPRNPVDDFITAIKTRGPLSNSNNPLPRRKTQSCTIADLGCGDAPLARALIPGFTKKLNLTIHSYDLHAPNKHVTVADIAHLPLRDGEADLAVFCLSLMGTNWIDFVEEAWRILRGDGKGEVWVAEVKSRFGRSEGGYRRGEAVNHSVGKQRKQPNSKKSKKKPGDEDDVDEADLPVDLFTSEASNHPQEHSQELRPFIDIWTRRGFQLKPNSIDAKNKMFVSMVFFKSGIPTAGKHKGMKWNGTEYERAGRVQDDEVDKTTEGKVLKPCVYKTR